MKEKSSNHASFHARGDTQITKFIDFSSLLTVKARFPRKPRFYCVYGTFQAFSEAAFSPFTNEYVCFIQKRLFSRVEKRKLKSVISDSGFHTTCLSLSASVKNSFLFSSSTFNTTIMKRMAMITSAYQISFRKCKSKIPGRLRSGKSNYSNFVMVAYSMIRY